MRVLPLLLLLLLAACGQPLAPPAPETDPGAYRARAASGAAVYAVDPRDSLVAVTVRRAVDAAQVSASGTARLKQTDFGITPFSVGGGLLSVQDELELRYHIVARRQAPAGGR